MGNCCLPIRFRRTPSAGNPKNVTLLVLGLDNAGKTTVVKRLAGEPVDSVVPTVGFSVILLRQKGCQVSVYDLGGGPQIRDIWPRYYADAHGIIFVADAHDGEKIEECRQVLEKVLRSDKISGKPVLLLANKQDLEGAFDEIDVVDRLNLEEVVNEQKCPTLVELCSALNFSKRIDIGIENGYKWLIRSIIRDYPALNNRVLKDLAKQEEENKIQVIRNHREESGEGFLNHVNGDPFKPVKRILEERGQTNGYSNLRKRRPGSKTNSVIPGFIEDVPETERSRSHHPPSEDRMVRPPAEPPSKSCSSEFFVLEKFQSDLQLLDEVANHSLKNFLVRPKSSGARLYGVKSEKRRAPRRKALMKGNKTRPSPFTDISNGQRVGPPPGEVLGGVERGAVRGQGRRSSVENVRPFVVGGGGRGREVGESHKMGGSKSDPNSRRGSGSLGRGKRESLVNGGLEGVGGGRDEIRK